MKFTIALLVMGILTENFILSKFLGICPFLGVSKKLNTSLGMSGAVLFVMLISTAATYPINRLLESKNMEYMQTVVFILIIAALVQILEIFLRKYMKPLYNSLGIYLSLVTTNCAILGVVILNVDNGYGFINSMANSLGAGLGFMIAMLMFAGVRSKMESCDIPKSLEGLPITLIAAALVSLSFQGFAGIVEGMGLV